MVTLEPLTIASYDAVLALWKASDGIGLSSADSCEAIDSYLKRNPGMSFLASDEGRVVGAILAGHDGRRGYIHHLAVHPDYRRQGLGRQLAERALATLARAGIQKVHIFVINDNADGISFWESIGWVQRHDIGVMSKIIEAHPG